MNIIYQDRYIADMPVRPIGLGCMNIVAGYGEVPDEASAIDLLQSALDEGYNFLDTASLYGGGRSEEYIAKALKNRRNDYILASKCGYARQGDGPSFINGRPDVLMKTCDESLKRLGCEVIDLYYLHRIDKDVAIEESVGALNRLVEQGKIKHIGLSEVSAISLRRALKEAPIAAVQSEYSLWTREPEIAIVEACKEYNVAFVAFSPLARQYLSGLFRDPSVLQTHDIRFNMPRFSSDYWSHNHDILQEFLTFCQSVEQKPVQVALAWLLAQDSHIIPIPGTKVRSHMKENFGTLSVDITSDILEEASRLINQHRILGERYEQPSNGHSEMERFGDSA